MRRFWTLATVLLVLVGPAVPAGAEGGRVDVTVTGAPAWVNNPGDLVDFTVTPIGLLGGDQVVFEVSGSGRLEVVGQGRYRYTVSTSDLAIPTIEGSASIVRDGETVATDTFPVRVFPIEPCPRQAGRFTMAANVCTWTPRSLGTWSLTLTAPPGGALREVAVTVRDHAPGDFCYRNVRVKEGDLPFTAGFTLWEDCDVSPLDVTNTAWPDGNAANFQLVAPVGYEVTLTLVPDR